MDTGVREGNTFRPISETNNEMLICTLDWAILLHQCNKYPYFDNIVVNQRWFLFLKKGITDLGKADDRPQLFSDDSSHADEREKLMMLTQRDKM